MTKFLEMITDQLKDVIKRIVCSSSIQLSAVDNLIIELKIKPISDLEEMSNDLSKIQDDMTLLLRDQRIGTSTRLTIERMRYRLATYLEPICCVCGESPARFTNDAYYCERCVIKDEIKTDNIDKSS